MIEQEKDNPIIDWKEKISACWLQAIPYIPRKKLMLLFKEYGSAKDILLMKENEMTCFLSLKEIYQWQQFAKDNSPYQVFETLQKDGISYVSYGEKEFPQKLKNIPDAPFGIYFRGKLPIEHKPSIAIVGARRCSDYGNCMTQHFAKHLAKAGLSVISGMAIGIDSIGQKNALLAGGDSYAVLGCGVDVIYPPSNKALYDELLQKGGIISEYPPGTPPEPRLFPPRNRIISGLGDALLVVEAREKSGTSITVEMALEQGKDVFVIPGRCTDALSIGCNKLLRQGATAVIEPQDIIEDMHLEEVLGNIQVQDNTQIVTGLSDIARDIYQVLDIMPVTQDDILYKLYEKNKKYSITQLYQGLMELELKGICQRTYGQYKLSSKKK